jgi:signal transduction histidine kinase
MYSAMPKPIRLFYSIRFNLILNATLLIIISILYFLFNYIIQPHFIEGANSQPPFSPSIINAVTVMILGLMVIVGGNIILIILNIFQHGLNLESNSQVPEEVKGGMSVEDENLYEKQNMAVQAEQQQIEKIKNERLYTMGSLASGIIHDFKNPISSISLCVEAIMKGFEQGKERNYYLHKIEDQVDRMLNMTQDFLDYAQGQKSLKLQEIEFTQTIKDQIEFHREKSEKKDIALSYSLPEPFYLKIDSHKFRRVLDNIITNAFEVLKTGQSIRIDISRSELGIKVQISDDGPGISPEIIPKIFDPFFTCGKSKGSGLGLSISKKIVEDHGGTLTVQSKLGQGCTFTIALPHHLVCDKAPKIIWEGSEVTVS